MNTLIRFSSLPSYLITLISSLIFFNSTVLHFLFVLSSNFIGSNLNCFLHNRSENTQPLRVLGYGDYINLYGDYLTSLMYHAWSYFSHRGHWSGCTSVHKSCFLSHHYWVAVYPTTYSPLRKTWCNFLTYRRGTWLSTDNTPGFNLSHTSGYMQEPSQYLTSLNMPSTHIPPTLTYIQT